MSEPVKAVNEERFGPDCPNCVRRERLARSVLKALAREPLPKAPRPWRARAVQLAAVGEPGLLSRAKGFLAHLIRDAGGEPELVPALRGEGPAEHHLLFEAGPFEVDLALIDSGALVGQVHTAGGDPQELEDGVCVLYSDDDTREAPLDADGDFHFASVRPGAYDLVLETPSVRLLLPDVDLNTYGESA